MRRGRPAGHNWWVTLATSIGVHPISPTIGAEISGVDLSVPLAPEVVAAIRDAWTTHHVIFFRDQSLTAEQQADFARQFGTVTEAHPVLPSIDESPEVLAIDGRVDRASWWHTDVTFLQTPAMGSILYMLEAPEVGGDTMWASLQDAYDGLAEPVRRMCDTLIAIHHDPWFAADVAERGGYEWDGVWQEKLLPALHPVVRTHPENGRNGLFVNRQFTRQLLGLSDNESNAILEMLYHHCIKPEYTCRFRWQRRIGRVLGQPGHLALRPRRLRRRRPLRPPGDAAGRQALRASHAAPRLLSAGLAADAGVAARRLPQHQYRQHAGDRGAHRRIQARAGSPHRIWVRSSGFWPWWRSQPRRRRCSLSSRPGPLASWAWCHWPSASGVSSVCVQGWATQR